MATGYTEDEVSAAVDRFIFRAVSVDRQPGGLRDVNAARDAAYDLLAISLLLQPDSYYYLIYLCRNAALAAVTNELESIDTLISAAMGIGRPARKVRSTTDLTNARAALTDLGRGLNERSGGVQGSLGPGIERFRRSVTSFVESSLSPNVVVDGLAIATSDELRQIVRDSWQEADVAHADLVALLTGILNARSSFAGVRLPETTIGSIVSRMNARLSELELVMQGGTAARDSRLAMLELLTMRGLIGKVGDFRAPATLLFPLRPITDASATLLDGPGIPPTALTSSGPFVYGPGTVLSLTVNGAVALTALPGHSNAELRSVALSFPSGPSATWELAGMRDFTVPVSVSGAAAPWASGAAAALALSTPALPVSFDSSENQLIFRSPTPGFVSSVEIATATANQQAFVAWAFPQLPLTARVTPVSADAIIGALSSTSLSATTSALSNFGTAESTAPDVLDVAAVTASDGVLVNGVLTAGVPLTELALDAQIRISSPPAAVGVYSIARASGVGVELVDPPADATAVVFEAGPDVAVGDRVHVLGSSARSSGWYSVVAVTDFLVELDHAMPDTETTVSVDFLRMPVLLSPVATTTSTNLGVNASTGATALGLSVVAPTPVHLDTLRTVSDLTQWGVAVGDALVLTAPGGTTTSTNVETIDHTLITTETSVPYEAGTWTVRAYSSAGLAWEELVDELQGVAQVDRRKVEAAVSRLSSGARWANEVASTITAYRSALIAVQAALEGYSVSEGAGIQSVLDMLQERGFDRMYDKLIALSFDEVFSMPRDGVSYATWLTRMVATASREITPVSKYARGILGYQEARVLSFQLASWEDINDDGQ
jgi:hypothetical protein